MNRSETRYVSPDRTLTFIIVRSEKDVVLGFDGTPWHTHGDLLGYPVEEAVSRSRIYSKAAL